VPLGQWKPPTDHSDGRGSTAAGRDLWSRRAESVQHPYQSQEMLDPIGTNCRLTLPVPGMGDGRMVGMSTGILLGPRLDPRPILPVDWCSPLEEARVTGITGHTT
jgi:hypothetical protein